MLTIYRRHKKNCPHRSMGRAYRRCQCSIWVDGLIGKEEIRHSLKLRNWEQGQSLIREWEAVGKAMAQPKSEAITIVDACARFIRDAEARGLRHQTIRKYRTLFEALKAFANLHGFRFLEELGASALGDFRLTWKDHNLAAVKKLERLRSLFRFACDAGWLTTNHAKKLRRPKVTQRQTMPFTPEQVRAILAACHQFPDGHGHRGMANAQRLRALILLLRHSGLRIQDAITLSRERIVNGRLFLYTSKSGVPVYCPLPSAAIEALEMLEPVSARYFFWTGESKPDAATRNWQATLKKLMLLAGVPDGHAHRFRDTFATELLLAGVPIERVSILLGHSSVRITEKYYAPWIRARQEQLEADVRRSWESERSLLPATKGTPRVHEKSAFVN